MLNIAAPEKFVLTLQSIPPFLIESILAFALAVLLAVPLIARLQLVFGNRGDCAKSPNTINTPGRHRRNRHIINHYPSSMATTSRSSQSLQLNPMHVDNSFYDIKQSLETVTSAPLTVQSHDQPEDETEEEKEEIADDTMSSNNQIMHLPHIEYLVYRHELIKKHLKKNYGRSQAPGNVVLNSIHLSSIDSQKRMKHSDKYNHTLFNLVGSLDANNENFRTKYLEYPEVRDLFFTKGANEKLETVDKNTETAYSSIELDQLPVMMSDMEHANTPTGSSRKQRPLRTKREKLSTINTDSDNAVRREVETLDANSRPNSARKLIGRFLNRPGTPRSQLKPKKQTETDVSTEPNPLPINEHLKKSLDTPERTQTNLNILRNYSHFAEVPVAVAAAAAAVVEKPEKPPSHVSSVVGKRSSMVSSEVVSTCSSKNPDRRPINTRPMSSQLGGGSSKTFRNLSSKVNSRPRSSGATFAWDKPDIPRKVPYYEEFIVSKIMTLNSKCPKSPHTPVNKKKSEVLSVLQSIIDLSCDTAVDFQESTVDFDIQNFREMSINEVSSVGVEKNLYPQVKGNSCIPPSVKKPKTPVLSLTQKRTNPSTKTAIDNKDFLRSRSGKYSKLPVGGHNRK